MVAKAKRTVTKKKEVKASRSQDLEAEIAATEKGKVEVDKADKKRFKKTVKKSVKKDSEGSSLSQKNKTPRSVSARGSSRKTATSKNKTVVSDMKTPEKATHISMMDLDRPAVMTAAKIEDDYELPKNYNETSITLLARDPYWLYLYWEISSQSWQDMRNRFGNDMDRARFILRVYDVTYIDFNGFNANSSFDIEVGPFAVNWYINLWSDNAVYCVDLAVILPDGYYHLIARSNAVSTPRASVSYRNDLIWLEVKDEQEKAPYINFRAPKNRGGVPGNWKKRLFLTDDEIRRYYEKYFHLLRHVLSDRAEDLAFRNEYHCSVNNISMEPLGKSVDDILDQEWLELCARGHEDEYEDEQGEVCGRRIKIGASEEIQQFKRDRRLIHRRTSFESISGVSGASGASLFSIEGGGASEQNLSDSVVKKQRGFFFEIGTELIVYGRTEPDAKVTMGGKTITLRPDGTFSLRFMLGDQTIPLEFLAESSNLIDKRGIATSVIRTSTQYKSEG